MVTVPEWIRIYVEPFRLWRESVKRNPGPPPPIELGRNLVTLDNAHAWLAHPSNWFDGVLDIIKWNGLIPTISYEHAWELAPGSWGRDMMLKVVILEQRRRRHGRQDDLDSNVSEEDTNDVDHDITNE